MIHTINGQPFINLDPFIDVEQLMSMKEQLCHAFTDAWLGLGKGNQALPSVAGHPANWPNNTPNKEETHLPQYPGFELSGAVYKTLNDETMPGHKTVKHYFDNGHPSYANMFLKLMGENQGIGYQLFIRQPTTSNYAEKHLADKTKESLYYDRFVFFLDWLKTQKIFKEIGRALIFFNDQDQYCLVHRDHNQFNEVAEPDQFIWLTVFPDRKKFFVLDGETGERHYFNCHAAWFDTANWHGSDPSPYAAFSIRVDGTFTKSWCKKIGYKPIVDAKSTKPKPKSKNIWQATKD